MLANNEISVGIAVSSKLSPDASIAMEGWINGFRWSRCFNESGLRHENDGNHIFYWDISWDFDQDELDGLTKYLERYFEEEDPRPYLCDIRMIREYYYVGEHINKEAKS